MRDTHANDLSKQSQALTDWLKDQVELWLQYEKLGKLICNLNKPGNNFNPIRPPDIDEDIVAHVSR